MATIQILYDFLKEVGGLERVMFFQAQALEKTHTTQLKFIHVDEQEAPNISDFLGFTVNTDMKPLVKRKGELLRYTTAFALPGTVKLTGADALITHSYMTSQLAYAHWKKTKTPYAVFLHHPPNFIYGRNLAWVNNPARFCAYVAGLFMGPFIARKDKKAIRNAACVFVNSNYTAKRTRSIYDIEPIVLYPPLGKTFKPMSPLKRKKALQKLGITSKYVLLHGRMIKDKRPDQAVRAFANVAKNNADVQMVISGTIEEEEVIKNLIAELGIATRVKILGRVSLDNLVALYSGASCFLMTAPKEDFGLTPIEAMACGCPVIAWADNAGPAETVTHGKTGFLAKPYSVEDFGASIEQALATKLSKKAIIASANNYSEKKIGAQLIKIMNTVLSTK